MASVRHAVIHNRAINHGEDTIGGDINLLPDGLEMYASYVDNFGGFSELVARFGNASWHPFLLSITVFGGRARCGDFEPGAMSIPEFPSWYDTRAIKDDISPPWGYTSVSNMDALVNVAAGRPFIKFSAHYGLGPHICGPHTCGATAVQCDWTQWTDKGPQGQNADQSEGTWLPSLIPVTHEPTETEDMLTAVFNPALKGTELFYTDPKTGEVYRRQVQKPFAWQKLGNPVKDAK